MRNHSMQSSHEVFKDRLKLRVCMVIFTVGASSILYRYVETVAIFCEIVVQGVAGAHSVLIVV